MAKKQGNNQTEQPERGKSKGKLILWIALSLVIAAAIALFFFILFKNLFGGRDLILEWLASRDEAYQLVEERENNVALLEQELKDREAELETEEVRLTQAEAALNEKASLSSSMASQLAGVSESRLTQLQWLGIIYSGMEPEQAAGVIENLQNVSDMAIVMFYVEQESLVQIMNCLDPGLAAQITEYMLA